MTRDELIAALEKCTTGTEALDREIAAIAGVKWSSDEDGNFGGYNILPRRCHFSRSRDAMLPRAERLLWSIQSDVNGTWNVSAMVRETGHAFIGIAPTEPLARRIAELKALVKA